MKDAENISVRDTDGGAVIAVKVVPGSSRDKIAGALGDCLKVTTSAAAEKGRANAAVAKILAKAFGLGSRDVELFSGPTNARKEFFIIGKSAKSIRLAINRL